MPDQLQSKPATGYLVDIRTSGHFNKNNVWQPAQTIIAVVPTKQQVNELKFIVAVKYWPKDRPRPLSREDVMSWFYRDSGSLGDNIAVVTNVKIYTVKDMFEQSATAANKFWKSRMKELSVK